ncbi:endonuclease/exonuclease/phosphatase family protein [Hufsiella ginkgonis]|uniref:Endonuclease/exonuclease/phosphatase n=1 Tax=Hufsiella ginkgonis TaxID=2695274 RepID=A0A7K1Y121_9SPHI|nr:endonuclease/exonuclease/phosphatase family protein [Hufsiella ginkgonis]MXV16931.1 endonuclease/exonuclease/phosphatase [Hufsiella ginkgonis]
MKQKKGKSRPGFFARLMFFANCIVAMLLLLSYLAPLTDPQTFWPIAFLGLAYPILLPVNLFFMVYWMFGRARLALVSLACILIGYRSLAGTFGFRTGDEDGSAKSSPDLLRVMTYNVHLLRTFYEQENSSPIRDQMFELTRIEQPDIICFQEFITRAKGPMDNIRLLKRITGTEHVYYVPNSGNDFESQGLAIFSRFPILNAGSLLFPNTSRGNEAIFADIWFNNRVIRVYNVHFQSIGFQPEDYKYMKDVIGANKSDDVKSFRRILSRLKRAFIKRGEQAKLLKTHTLACKTPFMVMGDFNDTPVSYTLHLMEKDVKNAFREKGSGLGITYNGDFPNFQIDYILASNAFTVKTYNIPRKKLSDHYAVRSDLYLAPPATGSPDKK